MKDVGKEVALESGNGGYGFSVQEIPCRVHPRASNVGVCSVCLQDRLIKLVCSECREQRFSSCSDDLSSNRNSSCAYDVGSVGRVSFLLENEKQGAQKAPPSVIFLRRSRSSCVDTRRSGIWNLGKLFRWKKKSGKTDRDDPEQCELWVLGGTATSRSRSLCNFRGSDSWDFSGGRTSSAKWNLEAFDPKRNSCCSEAQMRRSGFGETDTRKSIERASETWNLYCTKLHRRVFSPKESEYFDSMDERNSIDLSFFSASESMSENCRGRMTGDCSKPGKGLVWEGGELRSRSCRVTARDKNYGMKKRPCRWHSIIT